MALVAELDGLCPCDVHFGDPRRRIHLVEQPQQSGDPEDRAEDTDLGDCVRAAVKDLRHRSSVVRARSHYSKRHAEDRNEWPRYCAGAGGTSGTYGDCSAYCENHASSALAFAIW